MTTILKEERPALVTERDPDGNILNGTLRTGDPPGCATPLSTNWTTPPPDVAWGVPYAVCAPPPQLVFRPL